MKLTLKTAILLFISLAITSCAHEEKLVKKKKMTIIKRQVNYSSESRSFMNRLDKIFQEAWVKNIKFLNDKTNRKKAELLPGGHYVVKIGYLIGKTGIIEKSRVLKSSENQIIDQLALESVRGSKSDEAPPEEIVKERHEHSQIFILRT